MLKHTYTQNCIIYALVENSNTLIFSCCFLGLNLMLCSNVFKRSCDSVFTYILTTLNGLDAQPPKKCGWLDRVFSNPGWLDRSNILIPRAMQLPVTGRVWVDIVNLRTSFLAHTSFELVLSVVQSDINDNRDLTGWHDHHVHTVWQVQY